MEQKMQKNELKNIVNKTPNNICISISHLRQVANRSEILPNQPYNRQNFAISNQP